MPVASPAMQIGDYVIERELGRGAHGVVYRAHHRDRPGTPVALKVVESRGDLDRLMLEPALLSRLRHPCIVGIEDYFLRGDDLVLALEFIEGEDLKSLLDRGQTLSQAEVRNLLVQMAGALAEAHARNIIHRDIKPSNILVVRQAGGRLRFVLTDFGIGQVAEGIQLQKHTGGTFYFMAPEQLRGRPCPQSDLWALGVVAYRLLTGRMPFPGPSLGELSHQVLYVTPPPPSRDSSERIDPQLEMVVMKLLDKSLQERVSSAEELLRLLGHRGTAGKVLEQTRPREAPIRAGVSLDRMLDRGIAVRWVLIVVCVLFYLLPWGLPSGVLTLLGMVLFYKAQREERWSRAATALGTLAAWGVLAGSLSFRYLVPQLNYGLGSAITGAAVYLTSLLEWLAALVGPVVVGISMAVLAIALPIIYFFLPVIAGALYATMRRLERERVLRQVALESGTTSEQYLDVLRATLDTRFRDVGLHLKYAEALFARGRVKEAAVEAELLLRQDPYHFNGNLLLANAYYTLGLREDCAAVCDRYLAVSGYCFEFSELREQCRRRASQP